MENHLRKKPFFTRFIALFKNPKHDTSSLEETVDEFVSEHSSDGQGLNGVEKEILHNLLNCGEIKVHEVMIPRSDITAIPDNIELENLKEILIAEEHTRMPVYKNSLDEVIGFIHIKDLVPVLSGKEPFNLQSIIRDIMVVSPSMKVIDLLVKMRNSRTHIALVIDEYGGTDGLITIEDVVEEIVGEIEDEHDEYNSSLYNFIDEHSIEASGRLKIKKLEELFSIKVEKESEEDFDTLGGLVLTICGHVPEIGEKVHYGDIEMEVISVDSRKVNNLIVRRQI